MDEQKKPGVGFWATVVVVTLLVLYPVSFGPACWFTSRFEYGRRQMPFVYRPVTWVMEKGPSQFESIMRSYCRSLATDGWDWDVGVSFKINEDVQVEVKWEWQFKPYPIRTPFPYRIRTHFPKADSSSVETDP